MMSWKPRRGEVFDLEHALLMVARGYEVVTEVDGELVLQPSLKAYMPGNAPDDVRSQTVQFARRFGVTAFTLPLKVEKLGAGEIKDAEAEA